MTERVLNLMRVMCHAFEVCIITSVVNKDHLHTRLNCSSSVLLNEIKHWIKGKSSATLFEESTEQEEAEGANSGLEGIFAQRQAR